MSRLRSLATVLCLCLAALMAGCGAEEEPQGPNQFAARWEPLPDSPRGGKFRVVASSELGSLDPGQTIYQSSVMITFASHRNLLASSPAREPTLMPDLAESMPKVDAARGTLTFRLRDGVRYSPPVDREVRADDIKYAIERALLPGVANGEIDNYLGSLKGFGRAKQLARENPRSAPEISGITCPSDDQIVFSFKGPVPFLAQAALTLPVTAPVPRDFARPFDREIPSAYGDRVVSTGPYMVARSRTGELTGYRPGRSVSLVRNPNWDPAKDFRPAFLDAIEIESGYTNLQAASEKILTGDSMINGDFPPTPLALKDAATRHSDQLTVTPSSATLYSSLNTKVPPFDNPDVRRAVIAATDRNAMRLAAGGEFAGELATHFLPPSIEGFEAAGGFEGPGFDFLSDPGGDPELAASYMRRAGYPSGRYEGDARPVMVTGKTTQGRRFAEILRQALDSLGIEVELITVSRDTMYSSWCNVPAKRVGSCADVGWIGQFGDGQTMLDATFNGAAIVPVNNSNWPLLDVPVTNRAIDRAKRMVDKNERAARWGKVDRLVTSLAPAVPILWVDITYITSSNVNLVLERSAMTPALSMISLDDG